MHPISFLYSPAAADADGYVVGATGAGPFTPLVSSPGDGLAHLVTMTTTDNLIPHTFTFIGTDMDGLAQTEAVPGVDNNTATSTKYFGTVTSITVTPTMGVLTANLGWAAESVNPAFPLNWRQRTFQVSLGVDVGGTINYTVQHCLDRLVAVPPQQRVWWDTDGLTSKTADLDGNYAFPVTATRIKVNSVTPPATVRFYVVQGF
jgi:hypothetical protein